MKSSFTINRIAKYTTILIVSILFIYGIYWLWQRQPRNQEEKSSTAQTQTDKTNTQETLSFTPQDTTIVSSAKIEFVGKTNLPQSYVLIFSSDFQFVTKTDKSGKFQQELALTPSLNLVDVVIFSKDFKENSKKTLTFFLQEKEDKSQKTVFAGTVKTIFDNIITLSTQDGEKTVKALQSTQINLPKPAGSEEESTGSALSQIRVGDYLIGLGSVSDNQLSAKNIEIIRENKPQNTKQFTLAKILSLPRLNIFSAAGEEDKIIEFLLDKNSQITQEDKKAQIKNIAKDKSAFIFYHPKGDQNLVDLIYLLP